MSRTCSYSAGLVALLASLAVVHGEDANNPRTDLDGDPLPTGAVLRLGTIQLRHADASFTFSADGKTLISAGNDGMVRRWNVATGRQVSATQFVPKVQERETIACTALTQEGDVVAVWHKDGLFLHDAATGRRRVRLAVGRTVADGIAGLTFSRDGKSLIVLNYLFENHSSLQVWDVDRGEKRAVPSTLGRLIGNVAISPDGKYAVARTDSGLTLWNTTTGKIVASSEADDRGLLTFAPDGKTVAVAETGRVTLREATTLKVRGRLKAPEAVGFPLTDLAYSRDGRWLAAGGNNGVIIWDMAGRHKPRQLGEQQVFNLAFTPDGGTLAWNDGSCILQLWDVGSGRRLHDRPGHSSAVKYLAASRDGKWLASATPEDPRLLLWDASTGRLRHALRGLDVVIGDCLFSPDGKRVTAAGQESIFQTWDTASGELMRRLHFQVPQAGNWDIASEHSLALSTDGKRLSAICSQIDPETPDEVVLACGWNAETGKLLSRRHYLAERRGPMPDPTGTSWLDVQAAFTPDAVAVTARVGRTVNLEDVTAGRVLARFPSYAGRPMIFSPDGRLAAAAVLDPKKDPSDGYTMKGLCLIETATGQEVLRLPSAECSVGGSSPFTPLLAFTPDTQDIVLADREALHVWETATGVERFRLGWPAEVKYHRDRPAVCSLAVLPNGRAATGMEDGTILVWDLRSRTPPQRPATPLAPSELETLWADLGGEARKAHHAIYRLAAAPAQTMPLLRARLRSATATNAERIEKLLADLDGAQFEAREAATHALLRLRERIEPRLRHELENRPPPETRRRLHAILEAANPPPAADTLRVLRAITVLERLASREARRILEKLAGGAESSETRAAQATLQRLKQGDAGAKEKSTP